MNRILKAMSAVGRSTRSSSNHSEGDRIDHGHHVFRAYFKHAFLKQPAKKSGQTIPKIIAGQQ